MKKLIVLMLVLALCVSLCACGGNENRAGKTSAKDEKLNAANGIIEEQVLDHPLLPQLHGSWETDESARNSAYTKLTINEDGTCVVDGNEATWNIGGIWGNETTSLEIEICIDGERKFGALLDHKGNMWVIAHNSEMTAAMFKTTVEE